MKQYTVNVLCRGCNGQIAVKFDARPSFESFPIPLQCPHCDSQISVLVKRGMFKRQLLTKVRLISHTKKLLDLLEEGLSNAESHA